MPHGAIQESLALIFSVVQCQLGAGNLIKQMQKAGRWHVACGKLAQASGKWQVGHKYASISCAHTHTCTRRLNALNSVFGSAQLRDTLYATLVFVFPHTHTDTRTHEHDFYKFIILTESCARSHSHSLALVLPLSGALLPFEMSKYCGQIVLLTLFPYHLRLSFLQRCQLRCGCHTASHMFLAFHCVPQRKFYTAAQALANRLSLSRSLDHMFWQSFANDSVPMNRKSNNSHCWFMQVESESLRDSSEWKSRSWEQAQWQKLNECIIIVILNIFRDQN